jgi:hypothetical protein
LNNAKAGEMIGSWFKVNGYFNLNANVNCFEHEMNK